MVVKFCFVYANIKQSSLPPSSSPLLTTPLPADIVTAGLIASDTSSYLSEALNTVDIAKLADNCCYLLVYGSVKDIELLVCEALRLL